LYKKY